VPVTQFIGSFTRNLATGLSIATRLKATGTATAVTSGRHCLFSTGNNSSGNNRGLTTTVNPIAAPAHHSWFCLPSSSQRKNNTSSSRMQPLMLPKTSVLTTLSVQNIATSKAGRATDAHENLNSFTSRNAAMMMAIVLNVMNQYREASTGR
jgi:hypothetical protein